jgi:signal transduction histidine kinase
MVNYVVVSISTAAISLGLGLFVLFKGWRKPLNRVWALLSLSVSGYLCGFAQTINQTDHDLALIGARILTISASFIPSLYLNFICSLDTSQELKIRPLLISYSFTGFFSLASFSSSFIKEVGPKLSFNYYIVPGPLYYLYFVFFVACTGYGLYTLIHLFKTSPPYGTKRLLGHVLIASVIGFGGGSTTFLPVLGVNVHPIGMYFVILYSAIISYSIIRYRLMDITTVIHKTAMWAAMSSLIILPIGGLFYFAHNWINNLNPYQLFFLVSSVILLLIPYIKVVQPRIDHLFERRKHDLQKILQDFIHEIVVLKGLNELVSKLQATITSVLYPERTSIILFDVKSDTLKPFQVSGLSEEFYVDRHPDFLKWLEQSKGVTELDLIEADPRHIQIKDQAIKYFKAVGGKLAVPLTHDGKLLGVINLGQKKNLKPYTGLDLDFLSNLKVEASIAFSNALLYDDVSKMSQELKLWATELEHKVEERTKELAESKQEVEKAYAKLKELDAIKTQFFANVSHELRTPLTLVLAPLESILKGELGYVSKSQQGHIQIMHQNALRLLKMINNLLDLAKIDAGKMTLNLEPINLDHFIKGIVASVTPLAEKKQIRLSFVDGERLTGVVCDREKVERVLLNLIFNSIKFTEPGGSVTVRCEKANSTERDESATRVQVSVADTGIGIPKEYKEKIFERFSQVDASASRKYEGTGIGLALAKELVELHRGRIWADSEPGKGTVMTFTLPTDLELPKTDTTPEDRRTGRRRARERRETERRWTEDWTQALRSAAEYSAGDVLKEPVPIQAPLPFPSGPIEHTVLLIEDNADMRSFIAFQLQDEFKLLQARDGIEGVGLATQHLPDIIISDVMMPGKDGYQVCREIKSDPHTKHIPVILLTAKAELSEKISGLEFGADDYLTKPFNAQELKAKIRSLVQLRRLEREIQNRSEELERTLKMLQETQTQLVHSEKMAALGLLVAGIAHEVNNPVSFAKGSLSNLRRYLGQVREALEKQPETRQVLTQFNKLLQDIEQSLNIVKSGLERTEGIVTDLKTFARKDEQYTKRVDIQEGLEATLKLIQHEMTGRITVHRDYGIQETVEIIPGQVNQVFMNLLQNAIHAIPEKGDIWIRTWEDGDRVHVAVRDSGKGIQKEHLGRIFEPFFTTKEVGQGTGLGLSVSYRIIENHGGKITVSSEEGKGAEFVITLPKRQLPDRPETATPADPVAIKGNRR